MIVRSRDNGIRAHLWDTSDALLDLIGSNRLDGPMALIAARLWPADDGWSLLVTEPVSGHTLFVFTHPVHGIVATLMRFPGPPAHRAMTHNEAETERRDRLSDYIISAYHAHGATRIDLLETIGETNGPVDHFKTARPGDRHFLDVLTTRNLLDCPAFMDEPTRTLLALGACRDLIDEATHPAS
jgi:hypothetical protein